MFAVLPVMRQLHEILWHLADALDRPAAQPLLTELLRARAETARLTGGTAEELAAFDVVAHRARVGELLERVSTAVRMPARGRRRDRRNADLVAADLRGADLRGVSLRGAYLIGANLRGADLRTADLLGADLRAADLRGADLSDALFLTRPQLTAASGDEGTRLPPHLDRPGHWPTGG